MLGLPWTRLFAGETGEEKKREFLEFFLHSNYAGNLPGGCGMLFEAGWRKQGLH